MHDITDATLTIVIILGICTNKIIKITNTILYYYDYYYYYWSCYY